MNYIATYMFSTMEWGRMIYVPHPMVVIMYKTTDEILARRAAASHIGAFNSPLIF